MARLLVLLALLAAPASAAAGDLGFVEGGAGYLVPLGGGWSGPVGQIGLGALFPLSSDFSFGVRLKVFMLPALAVGGSGGGAQIMWAARLRLPVAGVRGWVGAAAGYGQLSACLYGDFCGGSGLAALGEAGVDLPLGPAGQLEASFQLSGQGGMANGVGTVLIPSLMIGLGFGP